MTKPIQYYVSGHHVINQLEMHLGSNFENLSDLDKIMLLCEITNSLKSVAIKMSGTFPAQESAERIGPLVKHLNKALPSGFFPGMAKFLLDNMELF